MCGRLAKGLGGGALVVGLLGLAFVVAMRTKFRPVHDVVRRMNKSFWNPRQMETAGRPDAYASIIRHTGRTTGTVYDTPVGAVATEDGFVVPLPYGRTPDWLKNVLRAGRATIVHEGETYEVDHPSLVPAAVADPYVSPLERRMHRWFGIDEFLWVRTVHHTESVEPA